MRRFTPLSYFLFVLALPYLLLHKKLRQGFAERLGWYPKGWPYLAPRQKRIWVHGASAGDILALLPTVRVLKQRDASLHIIATTLTDSGRKIATDHPELLDAVAFCPYDLPGATRRAMRRIAPSALVLEYTELWPQLVHAASTARVLLFLHNGRISQGKLPQYRWLFVITGNLFKMFSALLMRDAEEAGRALILGAPPNLVEVTGNTKFDQSVQPESSHEKRTRTRPLIFPFPVEAPVWVIGSSHEGEENNLLDVFCTLRQTHTDLKLLIAPRYVDRGEKIASRARQLAMQVCLRSKMQASERKCDVFVLDTIGELMQAYERATLVFVGGSFVSRGGQNILEPAMCGKPVVFGPDMRNFSDSVQVLHGRGGVQVQTFPQLLKVVNGLLSDPKRCQELGSLAQQQVSLVSGAAARNAGQILRLITTVQ